MTIEEMGTIIQADKMIRSKDSIAYRALMDSAYGAPKQEMEVKANVNLSDEPIIFE